MVMEAPPNPQMVKEAPPNPQCVGREFVRQYYTLLNACPAHLHRFYNNNSSFVHGGLDAPNRETKPVVGQKQIHQKIQQLNFRDCHAKISQVDSQATLGNGVVVQVTGELSNCGQPMRRFTQTFVLAAQSPKQYYVHNDIFRYQDIMFSDEEVEQDSGHSAAEEDNEPELPQKPETIVPTQQMQPPQTMAYYNAAPPNNTPVNPQQPPPPQLPATLPHQLVAAPNAVAAAPPPVTGVVAAPVAAVVNGSAHPEEVLAAPPVPQPVPQPPMNALPPLAPMPQTPVPMQPAAPVVPPTQPPCPPPEEVVEPETPAEEEADDWGNSEEVVPEEEEEKEKPQENTEQTALHTPETGKYAVSNEPKTYANLVKSGTSTSSSFSSAISTSPNVPAKPPTSPPPAQRPLDSRDSLPLSAMSGGGGGLGLGQRGARRGGSVRGMGRVDRGGTVRGNFNDDLSNAGGDGNNRRVGNATQQYSDTQQLFMGNLPLQATEDDLKALFSKFGPIIDLRILSKSSNSKNVPGNRLPNYGFIVFESAATVQAVLNSRPIYFPDENGQKLNVEEKKTKMRPSMDGARMSSGGDNMLGGGRPNSGMGGGRGGPGMMRGGPGMHRGGGRGGFSRGDGRGGGMNRGAGYTRR